MSPVRNQPSASIAAGSLRVVPVALHHVVAADHDLARLAERCLGVIVEEHLSSPARIGVPIEPALALAVGVVEGGDGDVSERP